MKRTLLVLAAAVLFLSSLAIPTTVRADGSGSGGNNGNCSPPQVCKP